MVKNNNVGIQCAECGCFAFDLEDDAVRHFLIKILQVLPAFNFLFGQLSKMDTSGIREKGLS